METAIQKEAGRLFRFLEKRLLKGKLPGEDAQARLSPRPLHSIEQKWRKHLLFR